MKIDIPHVLTTLELGHATDTTLSRVSAGVVAVEGVQLATGTGTASGTNTGDQTITLTGGVTGSGTGSFAATVVTNANLTGGVTSVGNAATVITNANLTGGVTSVGNAATVITNANLTGGVTSVGNAATVITNANLTGVVTSTGNATAIADNALSIAKTSGLQTALDGKQPIDAALTALAAGSDFVQFTGPASSTKVFTLPDASSTILVSGGALGTPSSGVATNLTGTASGLTAGTVTTNANLTGDATSSGNATTVVKINGTTLSALATGILKNTTATGVPSIAVNSDLPVMSATVGGAVPTPPNNTTTFLRGDGTFAAPAGSGTVTSVSVTTANGVSGSVATATTTPAITLTLGAITPSAVQVSGLTASEILSTDASKNLTSLAVATYPSLTELAYVKGVTSAIQTQINTKGAGTVTSASVVTANGVSGSVATATTTPAITLTLGAITPSTVNGNTITTGTGVLTLGAGKTLTANNSITLAGTDATTMTFPTTSATIARTDAANSFTGTNTFGSTTSLLLGTAGSAVGNIGFRNATSGTATIAPPTGALGAYSVTLPNAASTLPIFPQQVTFTGPSVARTITVPDANFTVARTDAANTFTGVQTMTSPALTTPAIGAATGSSVTLTGTAPQVVIGANTTTLGSVKMFGNTSGDATVRPAAVAGTATVVTLPNANSTLPIFGQQITFIGPSTARTITLPDAAFTVARTDAANTFTGVQTMTSPNFTTPVLGTVTSGNISACTSTSMTMVTPVLGTPTSGNLSNCTGIQYNGFKNKVIGSDFTINPWQRGTSFAAIADGAFSADRWRVSYVSAAVNTISKATDAPTATQAGIFTQHCLSIACTTVDSSIAAGDYWGMYHPIEGYNTASFGFGQTGTRYVTLSFWVKGTKTGIHCVALQNSAGNRSYVAEYTINVTNTWEYKTITVAVDTTGTWLYDNSTGVYLSFTLMCGTTKQGTASTWTASDIRATSSQVNAMDANTNVFKLALVQLEAGQVATAYDVRSVQQELALCQRYYSNGTFTVRWAATAATQYMNASYSYPVAMRASPTLTNSGGSTSNVTTTDFVVSGTLSARTSILSTAAGDAYAIDRLWTASSEL